MEKELILSQAPLILMTRCQLSRFGFFDPRLLEGKRDSHGRRGFRIGGNERSCGFSRPSLTWHGMKVVFKTLVGCLIWGITLPETNIAPENRPLEREIEIVIGNHHF